MTNFTSNTYTLKSKILTFTNKISRHFSKPDKKFTADITYGMLAAESCLLTDVADQLHESSKKLTLLTGYQSSLIQELLHSQQLLIFMKLKNGFLKCLKTSV